MHTVQPHEPRIRTRVFIRTRKKDGIPRVPEDLIRFLQPAGGGAVKGWWGCLFAEHAWSPEPTPALKQRRPFRIVTKVLRAVAGKDREAMTVFLNYPTYVLPGPHGCLYGFAHALSQQFGTPRLVYRRTEASCSVQLPPDARWPRTHTTFMYWVKQALLRQGFDVVQKRAWKDGHLVDDWVTYIRTRKKTGPYSFYVHDSGHMTRSLLKKDNRGGGMGERKGLNVLLAMQWALDRDPDEEVQLLEPGCTRAR